MERRKRRWWTRSITWLSLVAISGALLSALFQLAVALAPGYRQDVAQRASTMLGQPVEVDALSLRWRWLWPLLELQGVRLLEAEGGMPIVDVGRIRLGFDLGELMGGNWAPAEVEIEGVTLSLEITPEGQWRLRGRNQTRPPPTVEEVARALKRFSRLRAQQVTLAVADLGEPKAGFTATLQKGDLRMDAQGFELRAELQAPEVLASRLRLRAGIKGDLARPQAWQGRWSLDASGIAPGAAVHRRLPALARVQWRDAALTAAGDWLQGSPGASELSLRAQSLALADDPASTLRELDLGLHYRPSAEGGTLDVVPLRLTGRKGAWPTATARLDWRRATVAAGAPPESLQWRANSDFLRLDDLAGWAAVFAPADGRLAPALLRSLRGDIRALEARWQAATAASPARHSLHARFTELAFRLPGGEVAGPSVQGLNGEITSSENGGRAELQGEPLGFELPKLFEGPQRASRVAASAQWQRDGSAFA